MTEAAQRPPWVDKKINLRDCAALKETLRGLRLGTVCEEALCPNIGECFARRQATFLILGRRCTRSCRFCGVKKLAPEPVDHGEPARVAEGVLRLGLAHAVITSVTRDDIPDGGAGQFAETVRAIRAAAPKARIELLMPDLGMDRDAIREVVRSRPDIIGHNMETVKRLYAAARSGSDYERSLAVLSYIKECDPAMPVKSAIMVGLGETEAEVLETIGDIARTGCGLLSIGQYLAPSRSHLPVEEYVAPERFAYYREAALEAGFRHVESGTYVRSSYMAQRYWRGGENRGR
jgi:lipoic acid synthetase